MTERLKNLLIYGSCDGEELPEGLPENLVPQMETREGRLYWMGPKHLRGKSLVQQVQEQIDEACAELRAKGISARRGSPITILRTP